MRLFLFAFGCGCGVVRSLLGLFLLLLRHGHSGIGHFWFALWQRGIIVIPLDDETLHGRITEGLLQLEEMGGGKRPCGLRERKR
jgi:hypothetical protein